ncbi:MAG: hypothetical protein AVDCRST_MAG28-223 [uncultured Rubrobacteraceae bacterium]|uniref:Uncharacterized protein n=1 Tax=uncultured Rubrobacteraceae bacterium TaxID=349277 RepID=A0A6J4QLK9_9ACTN|nr:MAG: hypothetical protein AVDCRST_MAG28-223 [uncultured Rubrobacteraceae bacterium]
MARSDGIPSVWVERDEAPQSQSLIALGPFAFERFTDNASFTAKTITVDL